METQNQLPLIFRILYKLESIFVLFTIPFFLIFIFSLKPLISFHEFKNATSKSLILGKLKITDFNLPSQNSGGHSIAIGYVIDKKKLSSKSVSVPFKKSEIVFGKKNIYYFHSKYKNLQIGDTMEIWHSPLLDFVEIVPEGGVKGLIDFRKKNISETIGFALNMFLIVFVPYFISRFFRKHFQKKYHITKEEYDQYKKIAYKK